VFGLLPSGLSLVGCFIALRLTPANIDKTVVYHHGFEVSASLFCALLIVAVQRYVDQRA
jgi:hypothetical protein